MRALRRAAAGLLFALLSLAPLPSRATTLVPLGLADLTHRAERAALVEVVASESKWTANHDAIYTDVTVRVVRAYKGAKEGDTFVVRREGGTVDGVTMLVHGAASFRPGEEAVVFAEKRGAAYWVVGMTQGKLRVVKDAAGKRIVQAPELRDVELAPARGPAPHVAVEWRPRPLESLERDVAALVEVERRGVGR